MKIDGQFWIEYLADGAAVDVGAQWMRLSTKNSVAEDECIRPLPSGKAVGGCDAAHRDDRFQEQRHAAVDGVGDAVVGGLGALTHRESPRFQNQ